MNKQGHTPTVVLFVASIALYIIILFAFASFKDNYADLPGQASQVSNELDFNEVYVEIFMNRVISDMSKDPSINSPKREALTDEDFKSEIINYFLNNEIYYSPGISLFVDKIKVGDFRVNTDSGKYIILFSDITFRSEKTLLSGVRTLNLDFEVNNFYGSPSVKLRKVYK